MQPAIIANCSDSHRPGDGVAHAPLCYRIALDAFYHFLADDGWAIASHIALSALMAMFPFLIVVTALAGFFRLQATRRRGRQASCSKPGRRKWRRRSRSEIHRVLIGAHGGVLTVGVVLAIYFASSGIESLRIGLNRAYGVVEKRSWWLLRLELIGYVLIAAVGLLVLSFLVVLAPLILATAVRYVPLLEPFVAHVQLRALRGRRRSC